MCPQQWRYCHSPPTSPHSSKHAVQPLHPYIEDFSLHSCSNVHSGVSYPLFMWEGVCQENHSEESESRPKEPKDACNWGKLENSAIADHAWNTTTALNGTTLQ